MSGCRGDLYAMESMNIDEEGNWLRPEYPRYTLDLAPAKPFLVPSFDDEVVEVLPSEKQDKKIRFEENVQVMEIENRWQMMEPEELDDDESYEIEIVEGTGAGGEDDADFYLEMIDGEIFYVFETEDDISVDDESSEEDSSQESDGSETQTTGDEPKVPLQLNIGDMLAPNLGDSFAHIEGLENLTEELPESPVSQSQDGPTSDGPPEEIQVLLEQEDETTEASGMEDTQEAVHVHSTEQIIHKDEEICPHPTVASPSDTATPASPRSTTVQLSRDASPPNSPVRESVTATSPTTPRSILKACPPSPTKSKKDKKDRRPKRDKKEKTFTKTFVRASDFDGEHRVYSWEKPTWTEQQLKSTGKGDEIRKGGNLANPITDAAKLIEKGKVKWEKPEWALNGDGEDTESDLDAKQELIRKIQEGTMNLPGLQNNKRRLKLSINGAILQDGGDIVQPITKATIIKKSSDINYIANPKILRATPGGSKLWKGENLAAPVTQATTMKKYQWEKPSWVKPKLHSTDVGEKLKAGEDVAAPITSTKSKASIQWEKPDWTKKSGIGRSKSATVAGEAKKEYGWEKPSWVKARLKSTTQSVDEDGALTQSKKGDRVRQGENIAMPITNLPHMNTQNDDASTATNRGLPAVPVVRRSKSDDFA